jgi:hypothetical protein
METRGIQSGKVRLGFEQEVNQNQAVDNQRQTLSAGMTQTLTETLWRRLDSIIATLRIESRRITSIPT